MGQVAQDTEDLLRCDELEGAYLGLAEGGAGEVVAMYNHHGGQYIRSWSFCYL